MPSLPSPGANARSPRPGATRPLRIFIVENHEDTRFLLALLLEQLGHTVFTATTLAEALAAAPAARCDVLISDIGLPDGNGWELMARLGEERPPYAIAMSGFGQVSDRQRSLEAGYRHHLLKPVEPNRLEELLDEAARETARAAAQRERAAGAP
jgi:CheY-like chemotaxis protein